MNNKIFLVIFIILFLAAGVFAYLFYSQAQGLLQEKQRLQEQNQGLQNEVQNLEQQNTRYREQNRELSSRVQNIQNELDRVQRERNSLQQQYQEALQTRDALMQRIEELQQVRIEKPAGGKQAGEAPDEYWQDILQKKAELEAQIEGLNSQLKDQIVKASEYKSDNENLKDRLNDLAKDQEELMRRIEFNQRTIDILTKDLVREREDKNAIMSEINKLKNENVSLISELKLARNNQQKLREKLNEVSDHKEILQRKVSDMETTLKDKAMEIDALQRHLSGAIATAKEVMPGEAKAVELPPIVVKSDTQRMVTPTTLLEGRILSVNEKENFVIVDLGSRAGINPGYTFIILSDGQKIGALEVIETRADIAACDITEQGARRIREGDIVRYSP